MFFTVVKSGLWLVRSCGRTRVDGGQAEIGAEVLRDVGIGEVEHPR